MLGLVILCLLVAGVEAFTSFNSPLAAGNWNFPTESPAFGADLVKTLPDINVRYHYPHVDPSSILASAEDQIALQQRISDLSHEIAYDREALQALAVHSSFIADDAVYSAMNQVAVEPVSSSSGNGAEELMLGLSHAPHPMKASASVAATGCPRDFNSCPVGFTAGVSGCSATSYSGPCAASTVDLGKMSLAAKVRFSNQCGAAFPCVSGTRNYSQKCPQGWSNSSGSICTPPADYTGACQQTDFSGYNAAMLSNWEQLCGAYWA